MEYHTNTEVNDFLHTHKLLIIIAGVAVLVLIVVIIICCSKCIKQDSQEADYKHKTYSAVSEEIHDYGTGIND